MTGSEMMNKALTLLGYTSDFGRTSAEQRFISRAIFVMNSIYADLHYTQKNNGFKALENLEDEILLSERILNDVMPYGVAMLFAESESDGDNLQLFSMLYNQKRLSLTSGDSVKDVMTTPI